MKFVKKPIEVEAYQWTGVFSADLPKWLEGRIKDYGHNGFRLDSVTGGLLELKRNDWVIKGFFGELYTCNPEVFELTYDKILQKHQ